MNFWCGNEIEIEAYKNFLFFNNKVQFRFWLFISWQDETTFSKGMQPLGHFKYRKKIIFSKGMQRLGHGN